MTVPSASISVTLTTLKEIKNQIIGNPVAKTQLDPSFIPLIVSCVNPARSGNADLVTVEKTRIEAAHVISSLSLGPHETVGRLLTARAPQRLLQAILYGQETESIGLRSAIIRALKSMVIAIADIVGPGTWGIGKPPIEGSTMANAQQALEEVFHVEALNAYLPLLLDPSRQISTSIALLIASGLRLPQHAQRVGNWLPPAERALQVKGKRGWERPEKAAAGGGWIARVLIKHINGRDVKMQEAALSALAAVVKGNQAMACALMLPPPDADKTSPLAHQAPLTPIMDLCKSRISSVRLAACHCSTNILRASHTNPSVSPRWVADPPFTLVGVLNRTLSDPHELPTAKIQACFIFSWLVADDKELQRTAFFAGSSDCLTDLLFLLVSPGSDWTTDEPESTSVLIEATLTAIASLSLHREDVRFSLLGESSTVLATVSQCLGHPYAGVRYAACQCIRAFSRSVSVLRTSIGDSNLAALLFQIVKDDPDNRVKVIALMGIANMVNNFSPTRSALIESGVVKTLSELIRNGDEEMKHNAIWAVRNALYHATGADIALIMGEIGWREFADLLIQPVPRLREMAAAALTNMMGENGDHELVLTALPDILEMLEQLIQPSSEEAVTINALKALHNFGRVYRPKIIARTSLLGCIRDCLLHASPGVRKSAVSCVKTLVGDPRSSETLRDVGIESALRSLAQPAPGGSPGRAVLAFSPGWDNNDKETRDEAKIALMMMNAGPSN